MNDEELEAYLGKHLDWQVKGKPRGPLDQQSTIRLMILQAYRLGLHDGRRLQYTHGLAAAGANIRDGR
jgi:hypothetical protein